jgi:D-glycero-D-manno-heptose 1,7-bisphosphate phosphatase
MKVPVLFLDRDGIINLDKGFISKKQDFVFQNRIFEICRLFNFSQFKIVIITNQSGIGRGKIDIEDFHELNLWMLQEFDKKKIRIEFVIASALDPDKDNSSEYERFRRKPSPGMFIDAGEILPIDYQKSYMIGDKLSDGIAAQSAGVGNIYIISEQKLEGNSFMFLKSLDELLLVCRRAIKLSGG